MPAQTYTRQMSPAQLRAALALDIPALYAALGVSGGDRFTTGAGQTMFVLSTNPNSLYNLDVSLDGSTLVATDDYSWDGNVTVTLVTPTLVGQRLAIRYLNGIAPLVVGGDRFTATASQTVFVLSANPLALANIDVTLDGSTLVPTDDYTFDGVQTITLKVGALAGQRLFARYVQAAAPSVFDAFTSGAGQSSFVLSKAPRSLFSLDTSLDGATLSPVDDYGWDGNMTEILVAAATAGQRLLVRDT
jgi:hypothetical protein